MLKRGLKITLGFIAPVTILIILLDSKNLRIPHNLISNIPYNLMY
jgi:hypothetical protein